MVAFVCGKTLLKESSQMSQLELADPTRENVPPSGVTP